MLLRVSCTVCPDDSVGVQYPDPTLSLAPSAKRPVGARKPARARIEARSLFQPRMSGR